MSDRTRLRVYKDVYAESFRSALETAVNDHQGKLVWNTVATQPQEECRTGHAGMVHVLNLPYLGGNEFRVAERVGLYLQCPWVELRVQEESLWDYSLYVGAQHCHSFSTLPEYWDDDSPEVEGQSGNPLELASVWGVRCDRIERYLVRWGMCDTADGGYETVLRGKAYPTDQFDYGNYLQMYDFLRALGGVNPNLAGIRHRVVFRDGT